MTVSERICWLEQGEQIPGVEAYDENGRHALPVDPPFVAPAAGWYVCTMDTESRGVTFAPGSEPADGDTVMHFAGSEAHYEFLPPTTDEERAAIQAIYEQVEADRAAREGDD